jgi:tRNA A-37 threonylcarbamoyl transferase component Bud32
VSELENSVKADVTSPTKVSGGLVLLKVGKLRWQVRASLHLDAMADLLRNPDSFLADAALHFKNSRVVTVARVRSLSADIPGLVLRRLNYGKLRHRLRDLFRPSRARRALWNGLMLEQAGIATARAWAAAERRVWRWPLSAYLVTEEICAAATLAKLVGRNRWPNRTILHRLAHLIARLHDQGFSHRDLKATNILFDAKLQPFLIDLDGIRRVGKLREQRMAMDLAVLARGTLLMRRVSTISGWRFLKKYCESRQMQGWERRLGAAIAAELRK